MKKAIFVLGILMALSVSFVSADECLAFEEEGYSSWTVTTSVGWVQHVWNNTDCEGEAEHVNYCATYGGQEYCHTEWLI